MPIDPKEAVHILLSEGHETESSLAMKLPLKMSTMYRILRQKTEWKPKRQVGEKLFELYEEATGDIIAWRSIGPNSSSDSETR